jgi:hypothetical protein
MKITKETLRQLIKEELKILLEVDPTADPELSNPEAGSAEAEREREEREAAEKDPLVQKGSTAVSTMRDPAQYAEILKNVLLGSRLTPTQKKEAFKSLFGDIQGVKILDIITKAAPGIAK